MGDVLSLIEEAEQKIDKDKANKLAKKLKRGKKFDLSDFRDQIQQMNNLGGVANMLDKMPGMGKITTKRLMEEIGISETRKLKGLTPRQTKELTDRFS